MMIIVLASSHSAPSLVPAKGKYMGKDIQRNSRYFEMKMKVPSRISQLFTGKGSLPMQRFVAAIQIHKPQAVRLTHLLTLSRIYLIFSSPISYQFCSQIT